MSNLETTFEYNRNELFMAGFMRELCLRKIPEIKNSIGGLILTDKRKNSFFKKLVPLAEILSEAKYLLDIDQKTYPVSSLFSGISCNPKEEAKKKVISFPFSSEHAPFPTFTCENHHIKLNIQISQPFNQQIKKNELEVTLSINQWNEKGNLWPLINWYGV